MNCWWHLRPDSLKHHLSVQQTSQDKQNHIAVRSFSKDHFFYKPVVCLKQQHVLKLFMLWFIQVASNCTSFAIHNEFLLLTTLSHTVRCIHRHTSVRGEDRVQNLVVFITWLMEHGWLFLIHLFVQKTKLVQRVNVKTPCLCHHQHLHISQHTFVFSITTFLSGMVHLPT